MRPFENFLRWPPLLCPTVSSTAAPRRRDFGLRIVAVDVDAEGLRTDDLEALLLGGLRPSLVYCIPAFSNPTAVTMSHARRGALVGLAAKYGFTILADEVYQLLSFIVSATPESCVFCERTLSHPLSCSRPVVTPLSPPCPPPRCLRPSATTTRRAA